MFKNSVLFNLLVVLGAFALIVITFGIALSKYERTVKRPKVTRSVRILHSFNKVISIIASITLLNQVKNKIKEAIEFSPIKNQELFSNSIIIVLLVSNILLSILSLNISYLWYSRICLIFFSIFSPYYLLGLILHIYKENINRQIPELIDSFRSAFIEHQKIRESLKSCSLNINKSLGRIILKTANSPFLDKSLLELRSKFNNIWFNIFVSLLISYKENGGELTNQLYKLNNSMTRYNNLEKKKSKRLIMYEVFAVSAAIFCIPISNFLNYQMAGISLIDNINYETDILLSFVALSSLFALIVLRTLRKT